MNISKVYEVIIMLTIESVRLNYFKVQEHKELLDKAIPLIREVFGYTNEEIEGFKEKIFYPPLAIDVTIEQLKLALQPFIDHNITIYGNEYDDNHKLIESLIGAKKLALTPQTPKSHYYDEPVIHRNQLVDPYNPPTWNSAWTTGFTFKPEPQPSTPTITCPYCKSTNCKKISGLSKAGSVALWGIFALGKTTKQFHCNNCKADF